MKQLLIIAGILLSFTVAKAQAVCQPPTYFFNSISTVSGNGGVGSIYRFTNSLTGLNTFVIITKLQNATITNNNMDIVGSYALAWQPTINFTKSTNAGDSSYVEFRVRFINVGSGPSLNSINNAESDQGCMGMTVVDCDGPGNSNTYRELIKVSLPATTKGVTNSTISVTQDSRWINMVSGPAQFNSIDTTTYAAMAQVNFPADTKGFFMRVGVVGAISANLDRQFSFYFKSFTSLNFALPVNLISFNTAMTNSKDALIAWSTASELSADRFEIYKSFDGTNFELVGSVKAKGNSNALVNYQYADKNAFENAHSTKAYYKLKVIELSGANEWSQIATLNSNNSLITTVAVFPNPADKTLNVNLAEFISSDISIDVVDVYGKSIQHITNPDLMSNAMYKIDISDFTNGLYFIHISDSNGSRISCAKFIKE